MTSICLKFIFYFFNVNYLSNKVKIYVDFGMFFYIFIYFLFRVFALPYRTDTKPTTTSSFITAEPIDVHVGLGLSLSLILFATIQSNVLCEVVGVCGNILHYYCFLIAFFSSFDIHKKWRRQRQRRRWFRRTTLLQKSE